jgi:hypothetical protein
MARAPCAFSLRLFHRWVIPCVLWLLPVARSESEAGWGIDACLSGHVALEKVPAWHDLLKQSGVRILRERDTGRHAFDPNVRDVRPAYSLAKEAGFMVVAFGRETASLPGVMRRWGLSDDLTAVYEEGRRIGRDFADVVDVWELHNEPDVGYVPELPDRYAAHAKALYLGLKAGARGAGYNTPVILGALALPPGPWLERAARNGVLDYADAYNFHYYGNPNELTSVIRAHRRAQQDLAGRSKSLTGGGRPSDRSGYRFIGNPNARILPMWITECGVNATVPGDFLNAERRAFQAEFTRTTAKQALAECDVAVFMPFILVHKDDPHALVQADTVEPLPAWDAYARFTRENPWPKRRLVNDSDRANPVVLQWLPAAGTPMHKVAGTYRLNGTESVRGEFRVFNFSDRPVSGRLELAASSKHLVTGGTGLEASNPRLAASQFGELTIPAGGMVAVPVSYMSKVPEGYFCEWTEACFLVNRRQVSRVTFGLERRPDEHDFLMQRVTVHPLSGDSRLQPPFVNVEGSPIGPWRVFNGLTGETVEENSEAGDLKPESEKPFKRIDGQQPATSNPSLEAKPWRFSVAQPINDPLAPTYALAAMRGVPESARFLRLRLNRPMAGDAGVRVDLVDEDGQRFTIWENLGIAYGENSRDVWLGLPDFHPYLWSKAVPGNRRLRPGKVREIGLRFYFRKASSLEVELDWAMAMPVGR